MEVLLYQAGRQTEGQSELENENGWDAVHKVPVPGLVTEGAHSQQSTQTPAKQSGQEECFF